MITQKIFDAISLDISVALAKESKKSLHRFFNGKRPRLFGKSQGTLAVQKGVKQYRKKSRIRKVLFCIKHNVMRQTKFVRTSVELESKQN